MALIALRSGNRLRLEMLPWSGEDLAQWLLYGSLAGLISLILAVTGKLRFLFPVWALAVVVMMIRGYLLQPYTFRGPDAFYSTLWLIGGALLAFLASMTLFGAKKRQRF